MTLDQLIFRLDNIRRDAGHGNLHVLFRDPGNGALYDEIMPFLTEVFDDERKSVSAFDLDVADFYVEI